LCTLCPGSLNAFLATLADQPALELGNAAHDRQHQDQLASSIARCHRDNLARVVRYFIAGNYFRL
jgi:hypothetical protein